MPSLDPIRRELVFKIVFYGPGLGGKTTSLQWIHAQTKPERRGKLISLATETDRTLYFDYLPIELLRIGGVIVRLQLFTVPGQVYYAATRKLVLAGTDGLVFVGDSQRARLEANEQSLEDLTTNLTEHGRALSRIPHTFQWNKRDLANLLSTDELDRRLNLFGAPSMPTVATRGDGIFEGLETITRLVLAAYRAEVPDSKRHVGPLFIDADEVGLAGALKDLADSRPAPSGRDKPLGGDTPNGVVPGDRPETRPQTVPTLATTPPLFSLAELWPEEERAEVLKAEAALAMNDVATAILACDGLVGRSLGRTVALLASGWDGDLALVATLLGLDGRRIVELRLLARAAGERRLPTQPLRVGLESLVLAAESQRAAQRLLSLDPRKK